MTRRLRTMVLATAAAAVTAAIYLPRLEVAPIYLANDEPKFALQARAIAASGHDLDGRFLPVYFSEPGYAAGRDPVIIYLTAAFLKWLPFSEKTIRLPTALVGVLDVVLMFLLAQQLFKHAGLALAAAGLLALTPAHFMHSRLAVNVLYPLPFAMTWLLLLLVFLERERPRTLCAATCVLGLGVYSYLAAAVMMPLYLLFTGLVLAQRRSPASTYAIAGAGFALPLVPLVWWHLVHPARYGELISSYHVYDTGRMNALQGAKDLASYFSLGVRSGVYWDFFNPSMLFFSGDTSLINSTRLTGVFLWPVAFLLALGLYHIFVVDRNWTNGLLVAGFVTAPGAAVLVAEVAIRRALLMLPFAVLIAAYGLHHLFAMRRRVWPAAGVVLLALVALAFQHFHRDYFSDYRDRSGVWFGGNMRGGFEALVQSAAQRAPGAVYVSNRIPFGDAYWEFYAVKLGREDLLKRTVYYDPDRAGTQVSGAAGLILAPMHELQTEQLARARQWRVVTVVTEPNGVPSFMLYQQ